VTLNERIAEAKGWILYESIPPGAWATDDECRRYPWWMLPDGSVSCTRCQGDTHDKDWHHSPGDALELVDELVAEGAYVCIESPEPGDKTWRCSIGMPDDSMKFAAADTMAEAVCEAWLEVREG